MSTEGFRGTTDVFYSSRAFLNLTLRRLTQVRIDFGAVMVGKKQ